MTTDAEYTVLPDGSIRVYFPQNGASVVLEGAREFGVAPDLDHWHDYFADFRIFNAAENFAEYLPPDHSKLNVNITLEDVELALLQQAAPEWEDFTYSRGMPADTTPVETGSFTDTFGPGQVWHTVSESNGSLIVVNVTTPDHELHPGYVVRTVYSTGSGSDLEYHVATLGIRNSSSMGAITPLVNNIAGVFLFSDGRTVSEQAISNALEREEGCFVAGTAISMWDGTEKPIEEMVPDDVVTAYDEDGNLVAGRVTRVFCHQAAHVLDIFGLMVTPGHVALCGDGPFEGQHVPMIDILRSDGALVRKDGAKVRAGTNVPLGDPGDAFIWAITGDSIDDGGIRVRHKGQIRLGTRYITDDGHDISVLDLIAAGGGVVCDDGLVQSAAGGPRMPFHWPFSDRLPKPEDYVLRRSRLRLSDIYAADEWESVRSRTTAPDYIGGRRS